MFPRWRMFRQSVDAGELDSLAAKAPVKKQLPDASLEDRLLEDDPEEKSQHLFINCITKNIQSRRPPPGLA